MKIEQDKVVNMDYTLRLVSGEVVDSSDRSGPVEFIYGRGEIISGLEKQLEGLEEGAEKDIKVNPSEGYGELDPTLVRTVPKKDFPPGLALEKGMRFYTRSAHGQQIPFHIRDIDNDNVTIDFNHPLAGQTLEFKITIHKVRDATLEERLKGLRPHEHGPGCEH